MQESVQNSEFISQWGQTSLQQQGPPTGSHLSFLKYSRARLRVLLNPES